MRIRGLVALVGTAMGLSPAVAGDKPLYGPPPAWVKAAPPIQIGKFDESSPLLLVFDSQQRFENGTAIAYVDVATRIANTQMLGSAGSLSMPWLPEQGDLTVHRVQILRGGQTIDALAGSNALTVLRREEQLEQLMMTGLQTATMQVEGLQVGDVLRVSFSVSRKDDVLGGNIQSLIPLMPEEARPAFARTIMSWPAASALRWQAGGNAKYTLADEQGYKLVDIPLPLAKQPDMPADAPLRFRQPPMLEATSFADWGAVSKAMAPLYRTAGLIEPGSALAKEVEAIRTGAADPKARAALALRSVQDKVRYFMNGLAGGYYVPQSPAKTWSVRYGDCKAKTLLLLAMLDALGIKAEPVMASLQAGDLVAGRLPAPLAFDHVLVRADIGGETLWLDGTGSGTRLADLADRPGLRTVLPIREAGAGLETLAPAAPSRPEIASAVEYDYSLGLKLPPTYTATLELRGEKAAMVQTAAVQLDETRRRDMIKAIVGRVMDAGIVDEASMRYDEDRALATITAKGVASSGWQMEDRRWRMAIDRAMTDTAFEVDRAKPAWQAIPVATDGPANRRFTTRVRLPRDGNGFTLDGNRTLPATAGGRTLARSVSEAPGTITVEDRVVSTGIEIAPAALPAERALFTRAQSRSLKIVAPADYPAQWKDALAARRDRRYAGLLAIFEREIARDPDAAHGYDSQASLQAGVYDYKAALATLDRLVKIAPEASNLHWRGNLHKLLGQYDKSLADLKAARDADPGDEDIIGQIASVLSRQGKHDEAIILLDEQIEEGGQRRRWAMAAKAQALIDAGRGEQGTALIDEAIADFPGNPQMLNSRCWIRGTGNQALDAALKDCTKAIELADTPAAALDSRALIYYRMGRLDDARADLDAALDHAPTMAGSLFMRGVVRARMGDAAGAAEDLAGARLIEPTIDAEYARWGIKA